MGCYELVCEAEQLRKRIAELERERDDEKRMHLILLRQCGDHIKTIADLAHFKELWATKDGNTPGYNLQKARNYGDRACKERQRAEKAEARVTELEADVEQRAKTLELRDTQVMRLQSRIRAYEEAVTRLEARVEELDE